MGQDKKGLRKKIGPRKKEKNYQGDKCKILIDYFVLFINMSVHHIVPLPLSYKVNIHLQSPSAPALTLVAEPQTVALWFFHDPHKTLLFQLKME